MFDIGLQEILVIMLLALLVFGPEKLPELGKKLGRAMREFRRASDEFRTTVETNLNLHEDILPPSATPLEPATPATETPGAAVPAGVPAGPGEAASGGESVASTASETEAGDGAGPAEPFWASRGGHLLHRHGCPWRRRMPPDALVPVKALTDGLDQGLIPCPVCEPREAAMAS